MEALSNQGIAHEDEIHDMLEENLVDKLLVSEQLSMQISPFPPEPANILHEDVQEIEEVDSDSKTTTPSYLVSDRSLESTHPSPLQTEMQPSTCNAVHPPEPDILTPSSGKDKRKREHLLFIGARAIAAGLLMPWRNTVHGHNVKKDEQGLFEVTKLLFLHVEIHSKKPLKSVSWLCWTSFPLIQLVSYRKQSSP